MSYAVLAVPTGSLILAATERGVNRLMLTSHRKHEAVALAGHLFPAARYEPGLRAELQHDLQRYFKGQRVRFRTDLDFADLTPFQQRVLRTCAEIPWGRTLTYGQLAEDVGRERAARAVGTALACNPVPIVIPCHRVLAADGRPGGYSAEQGIALKHWLLELESTGRPPPWPR